MPIPLALIAGAASLGSAFLGNRAAGKQQKAQQAALDFEKEKWGAGQSFRDAGQQMLARRMPRQKAFSNCSSSRCSSVRHLPCLPGITSRF